MLALLYGNRIRCFPHVINIATQTLLRYLTGISPDAEREDIDLGDLFDETLDTLSMAETISDEDYRTALLLDPLGHSRKIVTWCRASGPRREGFSEAIEDGNKGKLFRVRNLQLALDEPTRWDSSYFMAARLIKLAEAVKLFLSRQEKEKDPSKKPPSMLSDTELQVLRDIQQVLKVAHLAQQALSSERTPTLSSVLRAYELIVQGWELLSSRLPNLKHAISAGLAKIRTYEQKSRQNQMFILAIVLNPSMKLKWIKDKWGAEEAAKARAAVRSSMLAYRRSSCQVARRNGGVALTPQNSAASLSSSNSVVDIASKRQQSALSELESFIVELSSSTQSQESDEGSTGITGPDLPSEAALSAEDEIITDLELGAYLSEPRPSGGVNMLAFWSGRSLQFPLLSSVALDVLPVQASSVPCERVFSSAKETTTHRRANLSTELMMALQVLKFIYRQERLDFTSHLVRKEDDYEISKFAPGEAARLLKEGKLRELWDLLDEGVVLNDD
ncbi:hypothetical protein M407DRAFT_32366 [Tulasnella calospora MUT 4182]|uniref:HAT C-terminal dimerisation domain-containing protein n=1 Tax=Tulasnella calospora MUT 4182 TaxID=1051891 RepID=A0A0C3K993_9AGAM|nr:hypothetical protein M407DRAFT_32366 [Tulasnella calospora MUT 4182]